MEIRQAVPDDAGAIRRVSAASMEAAYDDILEDRTLIESVQSPGFVDDLREWLAETADEERVIYLVAVDPDGVVGFIQVLAGEDETPEHVDPGEAFLKTLYVLPDRWNEGVGSALLDAGLERLPEDVDRVALAVLRGNDRAIGFYRSRGFRKVGTGTFEVGGSSYPTLRFAREC